MGLDVIVIGAGVAGLECARRLSEAGRCVEVLERSRGVGGRCASRRFGDQAVDYGPTFLHGKDPAFLAAVAGVSGATPLLGWPHVFQGVPSPPQAFAANEKRYAFVEGVAAFSKHLARGLSVRLSTTVSRLSATAHTLAVHTESGEVLEAKDVVIALALEQSAALLSTLNDLPDDAQILSDAARLLGGFKSVPSLVLIAGYPANAPCPPWDVWYPEESDGLQLVAHASAKLSAQSARILVLQAMPRWSAERLDVPVEQWTASLLAQAAERLGGWVLKPSFSHSHRWRYARVEQGRELAQPLCLTLGRQRRLGIAGDLFAPSGGVQAAWLSGRSLADRLLSSSISP